MSRRSSRRVSALNKANRGASGNCRRPFSFRPSTRPECSSIQSFRVASSSSCSVTVPTDRPCRSSPRRRRCLRPSRSADETSVARSGSCSRPRVARCRPAAVRGFLLTRSKSATIAFVVPTHTPSLIRVPSAGAPTRRRRARSSSVWISRPSRLHARRPPRARIGVPSARRASREYGAPASTCDT